MLPPWCPQCKTKSFWRGVTEQAVPGHLPRRRSSDNHSAASWTASRQHIMKTVMKNTELVWLHQELVKGLERNMQLQQPSSLQENMAQRSDSESRSTTQRQGWNGALAVHIWFPPLGIPKCTIWPPHKLDSPNTGISIVQNNEVDPDYSQENTSLALWKSNPLKSHLWII